jgi:predicted RNA-binding protein with EMAP domain
MKTMDSSISSIGDNELGFCFGENMKVQLGSGQIQREFIKQISRAEESINKKFKELCEQQNVQQKLEIFELKNDDLDSNQSIITHVEAHLSNVVLELKKNEIKDLEASISMLESEIASLTEKSLAQSEEMSSTLLAISGIHQDISVAADQLNV